MRITRRAFQRIALAIIAVCLIALLGPRLVNADHDHVAGVEVGGVYVGADDYRPDAAGASYETQVSSTARVQSPARGEIFLDETFSISSGDLLDVDLASSDLILETGSSSSQARVVIRGDGRDAAEEFERRRFSVDYSASTLDVHSNPERRQRSSRVRANFTVTITVPSRMDADVTLASGDVHVGDLVGFFEVTTASGDIDIGSVQGPSISIEAASGDITARRLDGPVSVSTASGDIDIQHILGTRVDLTTASGDISINTVETNRLKANSASGDVRVGRLIGQSEVSTASGDVSLFLADATDISTASGSVSLRLPRGVGFDVDLESPDIDIDGSLNFRGSRQRRSARGAIGSGGPTLTVSTHSGSIELGTE